MDFDVNMTPIYVYKCPDCGKTYTYETNFSRHRQYDCGKTPRCRDCGKTYKHKTHLSRHRKYECGKTANFFCPYWDSIFCGTCGAVFKHLASLKYHVTNNVCTKPKKEEDAKQLVCPVCSKLFKGITAMQYHVKRKVCEQVKVYSAPPFPCKLCGTLFNLKQSWYVHMKREACRKYPEKYGLKRNADSSATSTNESIKSEEDSLDSPIYPELTMTVPNDDTNKKNITS
ncbi:zinc finger protein 480-like [Sitophilus oryzae]|uniref:Zinc finger protein 480-like n=1 Tax=Sitophilus oryzae TaxID=7048 RepID=A0A6J2YR40_SITOR|nr:zinc finger protein 480-like [Sitophilus oryzae]